VIDAEDGLAACGMGVVDQRLPTPYNPDGRIGHVFGIVTDPACTPAFQRGVEETLLIFRFLTSSYTENDYE
jgi:hypothetical protein